MKRLLVILLSLLASCDLPTPVLAVKVDPIRESVGLVLLGGYRCSAVLVAPRLAFTAGHCIVMSGDGVLGAPMNDANGHTMGKVVAAASSTLADAGFLVLDRSAGPGLEVRIRPPDPGEYLVLAGYGCTKGELGLRQATATGGIDLDGGMVMRGRVCRGDSGGAVLDASGRLVGIMQGYSAKDKSRAYATSAYDLVALIESARP